MSNTPQTPAEQQALLDDALEQIDAGVDGKQVLRDVFAAMNRAAPAVWERIMACTGCNASHLGCPKCHADRLEWAALMGY